MTRILTSYRELGIESSYIIQSKKEDGLYKKKKKETKQAKPQSKKSEVLEKMIAKARDQPSAQTLSRIIQVVKNVFIEKKQETKKEDDGDVKMEQSKEDKANRQKILAQALNSEEYLSLVTFFAQELPTLALQTSGVKEFPTVDKLVKQSKFKSSKGSGFDVKKAFANISTKHQMLLKSYSANYNRLLMQALEQQNISSQFMSIMFGKGAEVAKCCIPFKVYTKKLANSCAKVSVAYSKLEEPVILLGFNTLRSLITWSQDDQLFEATLKRMYNEFARECKQGGGGFAVQNRLRICQNCFIELLNTDRSIGYQLGFQYIRQLCLHLRTIRNNMTKDAVKNVYSWQFYNCMKLWVLALTDATTSDLVLLVYPLVQLIVGVIKLANNIKYFPFHLKCFNLLTMINAKTGQFVPAAQYLLQPFDSSHIDYFNAKPRALQDKSIPDSTISLKVAKKHVDTQEIKDRIVKESLEALTLYFAANATSLSFPELFVPIGVVLRKFKKNTGNSNYRKMVQSFLELIQRHEDVIAQARAKIKDKSLRDPAKLHQQFQLLIKAEDTPLGKERIKIEARLQDQMKRKLNTFNA